MGQRPMRGDIHNLASAGSRRRVTFLCSGKMIGQLSVAFGWCCSSLEEAAQAHTSQQPHSPPDLPPNPPRTPINQVRS